MYVTDTHPWLWFISSDQRLTKKAESVFNSAERSKETIVVPSIVVAESIYIAKKSGYHLEMKDILEDLKISSNYVIKAMDYFFFNIVISSDVDMTSTSS